MEKWFRSGQGCVCARVKIIEKTPAEKSLPLGSRPSTIVKTEGSQAESLSFSTVLGTEPSKRPFHIWLPRGNQDRSKSISPFIAVFQEDR